MSDRAVYPSLAGKRIIVSGGASGIGEGVVEAFVRQGARVAFCDVATDRGEALVGRLSDGARHPPVFLHCDLCDLDALRSMIGTAGQIIGGTDVLINNAANDDRHRLDDVTPEYWDQRMAVNLRHLYLAAQAVVPAMRSEGGGVILNFGSISWHLGLPDLTLYQTAKAGIEGMTRGLARELGGDNIRVNTIVPGNVKTERQMKWYTPEAEAEIVAAQCLPGRILPEDVAALVLFLASDDARLLTAHDYFIDAGWR